MECILLSLLPASRPPSPSSHWGGNPMGWKSHVKSHGVEIQWGGNPTGNPMGWKSRGGEIPWDFGPMARKSNRNLGKSISFRPMASKSNRMDIPWDIPWEGNPMGTKSSEVKLPLIKLV